MYNYDVGNVKFSEGTHGIIMMWEMSNVKMSNSMQGTHGIIMMWEMSNSMQGTHGIIMMWEMSNSVQGNGIIMMWEMFLSGDTWCNYDVGNVNAG